MATIATSKKYRLKVKDFTRALVIALVGGVLQAGYEFFNAGGSFNTVDWIQILTRGAMIGGLPYLIKNFFTPSEIVLMNPAPAIVEAVSQGEAEVKVVPVAA